MKNITLCLIAALALAAAAVPGAARAAQEPSALYFSTSMTQLHDTGAYTGSLELRIAPDGTLRGYYFPTDYTAMFVPVVGGRTGESIWFDIGAANIVHVQANLRDGAMTGSAYDQAGTRQYTFTAATVSPDSLH